MLLILLKVDNACYISTNGLVISRVAMAPRNLLVSCTLCIKLVHNSVHPHTPHISTVLCLAV